MGEIRSKIGYYVIVRCANNEPILETIAYAKYQCIHRFELGLSNKWAYYRNKKLFRCVKVNINFNPVF